MMLVVVLFPNTGISQSDSLPISNSMLADTQRYQAQIQDFESEFGPMDNRLLEPLAGLINILVEQRQFERVAEIQSRQLSILRANSGFENLDLLPVLRSMIQVQQVIQRLVILMVVQLTMNMKQATIKLKLEQQQPLLLIYNQEILI